MRSLAFVPLAVGRSDESKGGLSPDPLVHLVSTTRRFRAATAVALAGALLLTVTGTQVAGTEVAADAVTDTGFSPPFSGTAEYEYLAPTQATDPSQINVAIGIDRADEIAEAIGLDKTKVLTEQQYLDFTEGRGVPGSADPASAKLADESVRIFINTIDQPLYSKVKGKRTPSVLGSYGLFVTEDGWLESLANQDAPTRIANVLLEPGGYVNTWLPANGAQDALDQLYLSAYTGEALAGNQAQQQSDPWQLVTNTKDGVSTKVGMSMAPALWLTNFALLYTLNPTKAAEMPAYWTPIPENVADAILRNPHGRVRYERFMSDFQNSR